MPPISQQFYNDDDDDDDDEAGSAGSPALEDETMANELKVRHSSHASCNYLYPCPSSDYRLRLPNCKLKTEP